MLICKHTQKKSCLLKSRKKSAKQLNNIFVDRFFVFSFFFRVLFVNVKAEPADQELCVQGIKHKSRQSDGPKTVQIYAGVPVYAFCLVITSSTYLPAIASTRNGRKPVKILRTARPQDYLCMWK